MGGSRTKCGGSGWGKWEKAEAKKFKRGERERERELD